MADSVDQKCDTGAEDQKPKGPYGPIDPGRMMRTDEVLARISEISVAINCECPQHLATLLTSLNAFEKYSADCENRNEEDALLHSYLHRSTAQARSMMEEALSVLAEAEGMDLKTEPVSG